MKEFIYIIGVLLLSSCITNKEVTYLQYKNELKENKVLSDSIVRTYKVNKAEYTIKPDDRLEIKIASLTPHEYNPFAIQDPHLVEDKQLGSTPDNVTKGYIVKKNGKIQLPMIGDLFVMDYSLDQIEDSIQKRAKDYLKEPVVKVGLLNFSYSILAENKLERIITTERNLTILEAISQFNEIDNFCDLSKVKIIRLKDENSEVIYLNLLDENILESPYLYIHPNDLIVLSPVKQRTFIKYFSNNLSIISGSLSIIISTLTLFTVINKN